MNELPLSQSVGTTEILLPQQSSVLPGLSSLDVRAEAATTEKKTPVLLGSGYHTYTVDEDRGKLPAGMNYGFGCGVIVDANDRIYVTSRPTIHAWLFLTGTASWNRCGPGFRGQGWFHHGQVTDTGPLPLLEQGTRHE